MTYSLPFGLKQKPLRHYIMGITNLINDWKNSGKPKEKSVKQ